MVSSRWVAGLSIGMRAFSAIADEDEREQRETERDAQADRTGGSMCAAMLESCVVPATSATVKTISSIAGSASEAIIISRDEPMPPNAVPTSMPASASANRRGGEQRDDGDQVGRPGEQETGRVGRHQRGGDPGGGEDRDRARRGRARRRCAPAPPPCASASTGRGRAAAPAGRRRRSSRAFTLRVTPSISGATASTRNICTPCATRSRISAMPPPPDQQEDQRGRTPASDSGEW